MCLSIPIVKFILADESVPVSTIMQREHAAIVRCSVLKPPKGQHGVVPSLESFDIRLVEPHTPERGVEERGGGGDRLRGAARWEYGWKFLVTSHGSLEATKKLTHTASP